MPAWIALRPIDPAVQPYMTPQSPAEHAAAFGHQLLRAAFKVCTVRQPSTPRVTPNQPTHLPHTCQLILVVASQAHESVRSEILEHILSRILTKASTAHLFVGLLHWLVRDCPQPILDHVAQVQPASL